MSFFHFKTVSFNGEVAGPYYALSEDYLYYHEWDIPLDNDKVMTFRPLAAHNHLEASE